MTNYSVKLVNSEKNFDVTINCSNDIFILDAAEDSNVDLPYSCRAGSCSTCVGKITEGKIEQSDQTFLDEDQMKAGFVLTCVSYPMSDCTILIDQEGNLY